MADLNLKVKVAVEGARNLRDLGKDMGNLGRDLTRGVTLPLIAAGAGLITMAADAEKSEAKMLSVFDSMGAAAWTSVDALNAHADAMANSTTFDDDAVRDAQAVLLTFGEITGDAFTDATEAAADLATFFETDMNTAALTLGKALQDPIAGVAKLGRQGIIFSDEQKEAIAAMVEMGDTAGAQALILDEVSRQVGDVAEDLAATSGGQMQQAINKMGEMGEALGTILLPVLGVVSGVLGGIADAFLKLDPAVKGVIVAVLGIIAVVGPVIWVGSKVVGAFQGIMAAFNALKLLLLTNPFIALAAAVVALVALIVLNWDKIVEVFEGALDFIADTGKKLWTPVSKGFTAAIDVIRGAWNAFARWWNGIQISVPGFDVPFVGRVGGFTIGLPDLPMLAEGGIVTQPTLALIGERGPEAVVPLDRMGPNVTELHIHLENHGPPITEEDDVIETLQAIAPMLDGRLAYGG
jgi:hypothetical protein